MPQFTMDLELPDEEDVVVRPATQYATLWSQFISDKTGSTLLYYLLAPFFFIRFVIVSLYAESLVVTANPQVYPITIPSTANSAPETPVAYTTDEEYVSVGTSVVKRVIRLPKLLYFVGKLYLSRTRIAYIVLDEDNGEYLIDSEEYFVTEDDDSIRPVILFRD